MRISKKTKGTDFLLFQITDLTPQPYGETTTYYSMDVTNQSSSSNSPFTNN